MSVNEKIRSEYGSLTHFARKYKLNYQSLRNTLNLKNKKKCKYIVNVLIEKGYIKSRSEILQC